MPRSPGRARTLGWLTAFLSLPVGAWLAAAQRTGFRGKNLSNLTLEPMLIAIAGAVAFVLWLLLARGRLRPLPGIVLLIVLSIGALALEQFMPGLRE
ncbi:MAG TPA: hypothetical protein VIA45_00360 [Thermoanaerobaculia bacterium]|jgi:hypothetical protein